MDLRGYQLIFVTSMFSTWTKFSIGTPYGPPRQFSTLPGSGEYLCTNADCLDDIYTLICCCVMAIEPSWEERPMRLVTSCDQPAKITVVNRTE